MGCDFYTYYKVCIKLEDGTIKEHILWDTRERHYYFEGFPEMDEDFEEYNEYVQRRSKFYDDQIDDALRRYMKKDIYRDSKWLCVESAIPKYKNIITDLKIPEGDDMHIWKQGGAQLR